MKVASNCLRPDGSFGARHYEGDTKTEKDPKSFKRADKWIPLARIKTRWMKILIKEEFVFCMIFAVCQNRLLKNPV